MTKTYFELVRNTREISWYDCWGRPRALKALKEGCTMADGADSYPEILQRFENKEEALEALKDYRSNAYFSSGFGDVRMLEIEEFYVEENTYNIDEDGDEDYETGGDIWAFAENNFDELLKEPEQDDEEEMED